MPSFTGITDLKDFQRGTVTFTRVTCEHFMLLHMNVDSHELGGKDGEGGNLKKGN